jgi:Domain of unknown function (DUF6268)
MSCAAFGQGTLPGGGQPSEPPTQVKNPYGMAAGENGWRMGASFDYSYVGSGDVSFHGNNGDSDAHGFNGNLTAEIPVNGKWFVPVGISSQNLFLDTIVNTPIPDEVHTLGLGVGAGYRLNGQWTLAGSIGPRFYRVSDVEGDSVGIAGMVRASYIWKPNLRLAFGVGFHPDSEVPVLPLAGLRWGIRTNLTLNLMWPRPALVYRVDERLNVFVGGGGNFTVFRADPHLGTVVGEPRFNNGLATYRDFHAGLGAEYRLVRGLTLGVEGGYSVGREIDYKRVDQTISFDPGPYCRISLRYRL